MTVDPFRIRVPDEDLAELTRRVRATRRVAAGADPGWALGTDPEYLDALLAHWADGFDWRGIERRLDALPQLRADVDGARIHVLRTGTPGATPVLLLHGWPGSILQMEPLLPHLAAFDVVTASLPGFGFSDPLPGVGEAGLADRLDALMTDVLHLAPYAVHGSDFGAGIAAQLAARHPEHLIAAHLSGTTPRAADPMPADATAAELRFAEDVARWRADEVGYSAIQSTRPQSLAVALADSPAGTAAWIVEKYRRWSDCGGDVERRFSKDDLLAVASLYWLTGAIATSIRLYATSDPDPDLLATPVPIGHLMSDRDMLHTPREWIARTSRIDRWTQVDRGGHFIEFEEPELVAADLVAFLADCAAR